MPFDTTAVLVERNNLESRIYDLKERNEQLVKVLAGIARLSDNSIKTNSRDVNDWSEDMSIIRNRAELAIDED